MWFYLHLKKQNCFAFLMRMSQNVSQICGLDSFQVVCFSHLCIDDATEASQDNSRFFSYHFSI